MPGYVVLPQNQNPLMSMFPQLIMQGLAYKQQKEMVSEQRAENEKLRGIQWDAAQQASGSEIKEFKEGEKPPENWVQNPFNPKKWSSDQKPLQLITLNKGQGLYAQKGGMLHEIVPPGVDATPLMKEYGAAVEQGFKGDILDYQKVISSMKQRSPTCNRTKYNR